MALDNVEFEFPDEEKVDEQQEVVEAEEPEDEIDIEVEDDTPEQDQGREPLPNEVVEELENDDLAEYSNKVKTRLSQMKKVWHDERRAKEAAAREREEAIGMAQKIISENRRLRSTLSSGEVAYAEAIKVSSAQELENAKREYKESYDSGDSDRLVEAQQRLTNAQMRADQAKNYRQQYAYEDDQQQNSLQQQQNGVNSNNQPQATKPDAKATSWQGRNPWFGQDRVMTSLAWGVHEDLVMSGISPSSDEYYNRIDNTMRKRFPEYFGGTSQDEQKPVSRAKATTVVAAATRSTAPKKVVLTNTQLGLAKKLGLTPKQYALEMIKLENR